MRTTLLIHLLVAAAAAAVTPWATATFHFMQIEQVIAGVDGDSGVQAIQLRMRSNLQNQMSGARLWVHDAAGQNPVLLINFTTNVAIGVTGARVLVASASFSASTNPAAVPDYVLTNPIPTSYLAAGSITFENNLGTVVYWRLSWGGAGYTGDTTGALTNDSDGDFGPPWSGPLPTTGIDALVFPGAATAASTTNLADYALTGAAAVFTNNAGASFTVESSIEPCPWDCQGTPNGEVDVPDFLAILSQWGQVETSCDFDGGGVSITDFLEFLANFGPCP
ncbi:MAG: hypothetical protein ACYSU7_16665 [Planctomycetota bacterium]|jgi:hypothetical protein